jgi:hypothetical protein
VPQSDGSLLNPHCAWMTRAGSGTQLQIRNCLGNTAQDDAFGY